MWRDLARALSAANLCFLYATVTLFLTPSNQYYMVTPPGPRDLAALLLNLLLLSGVLCAGARLVRCWENGFTLRLALLTLTALLVFGAAQLARSVPPLPVAALDPAVRRAAKLALLAGGAVATAGFLIGLVRDPRRLLRWGANLLLALFPFAPLVLAQAAWATLAPAPADRAAQPEAGPARRVAGRIVILLFDELDDRIAFSERPAGLALPEFDRFRETAVTATEAYPPAGNTLESIPALLCGRPVDGAEKRDRDRLLVRFSGDSRPVSWKEQPNLFSRARKLGARAAVVGWYHPYPRMVGPDVERCLWAPYYYWTDRERNSLPETMWQQIALADLPGRAPAARLNREHHIRSYRRLRAGALETAADPDLDLVFAHFPVPHLPGIYDRRSRQIAPRGPLDMEAYLGNLELADRTLGEVRRSMADAGLWETSTVVVTSDHWLRLPGLDPKLGYRVPLIVKLPGQTRPLTYRERLNTVLLHDLVLRQLEEPSALPEELVAWLNRRRSSPDQQRNQPESRSESGNVSTEVVYGD
jgi:hypothetical protein